MHICFNQFVCVAVLAVTLSSAATPSTPHHVARRSFSLECKGYNGAIFARIDRICDDCYNLFREPQLKDCFTTDYFKACVELLKKTDEFE
ncbi:Ion-transport peptide-like protein, partial [Operophtera brumata]